MKLSKLIFTLFIFLISQTLFAYGIVLGESGTNTSGSGCPRGSATISHNLNTDIISINFKNLNVRASKYKNHGSQVKNCVVRIPIDADRGVKFAIANYTIEGSIDIPSINQSSGKIVSKVMLDGKQVYKTTYSYPKGYNGNLSSTTDVTRQYSIIKWSNCSKQTTMLEIHLDYSVTNKSPAEATISIEAVKKEGGFSMSLMTSSCS